MEKIYLESSVISFKSSRLSDNIDTCHMQLKTKKFWEYAIKRFEIYISDIVIGEIEKGDKTASSKRLKMVEPFKVIEATPEVLKLSEKYIKLLELPVKASLDALHIALACFYKMDFLVTWNCKHIANGEFIKKINGYNNKYGIYNSIIITPDFLLGGEQND